MDFIKKNKFTVIALVLFILLFVFAVQAKNLFFPNEGKAVYGSRLDGKVSIDSNIYKKIQEDLSKDTKVEKITVKESARQIKVLITLNKDVSVTDGKKLGESVSTYFNENQLGYYDIEVFLLKTSKEENNFPMIGYKQHNSNWSWSKERAKTSAEDSDGGE